MKKKKLVGLLGLPLMMCLSGCDLAGLFKVNQHVHDWSAWEEIEPATCDEKGLRERYCNTCPDVQTRNIPVNSDAHKWVDDPERDSVGTCTTPAVTGSQVCDYCGKRKPGTKGAIGGHTLVTMDPQPDDPKYKAESTCSEEGLVAKRCSICGERVDEPIPVKGHTPVVSDEKQGSVGLLKCSSCNKVMGYELNVASADSGWKSAGVKMNSKTSPNNASTWNIGSIVEPGTYDIELEALMTYDSHANMKFYNMAKSELQVDGDADVLSSLSTPDTTSESSYRYSIKVDSKEFNPQSKDSWGDLGLEGEDASGTPKFVEFVDGVDVASDASTISLVHGSIGYSLICSKIRLIPHTHTLTKTDVPAANGDVAYSVEKCSCGYRKVTINALDAANAASVNKAETPDGYLKLASNGNSVSYSFALDEDIKGDVYLVGRQDTYPDNKGQTPYNFKFYNGGKVVAPKDGTKTCADIFGEEADENMANYSEVGKVLVNEVTLSGNSKNELKYERTGSYNIAVSQIVIEGKVALHTHEFVRDPSKDVAGTCTKRGTIYSVCSCGKENIEQGSYGNHIYSVYVGQTDKTCTQDGTITNKCAVCGKENTVVYEKAGHDMVDATPAGIETYYAEKCTKCGTTEVQWSLEQEMIEDNGETCTDATCEIVGKTSTRETVVLYRFDAVNRKVMLTYNNPGAACEAMFQIFASTKQTNLDGCQVYRQTIGQTSNPQAKFTLTVNGTEVEFSADVLDKTISNIGLQNVKASTLSDGSALVDPMWLDYYKINLVSGENTIEFAVPNETSYDVYIGGFGLSIQGSAE